MARAKYIVYYCVRVGSALQRIQTRKFKPSVTELTFKDKGTYQIDINNPTFITPRNKRIYLVEKNFGQIVPKSGSKPAISPELARALFKREWVKQLVAGMNTKQFDSAMLIYTLLGIMGGVGIGFIIATVYYGV
jgi:hypothetical protein